MNSHLEGRRRRALLSLHGLSIGDAFGERYFVEPARALDMIAARERFPPPWRWTDDTAMALSVTETLLAHDAIDRDDLARRFAARYAAEPRRGYGGTAHEILQGIGAGIAYQVAAGSVFEGEGSMGNGAAMRVAPLGGYFADEPGRSPTGDVLDRVVLEAVASAEPTHAHPDGKAGAVAVAIAAAVASRGGSASEIALAMWQEVCARTPEGPTRRGLVRARALGAATSVSEAVSALGNGSHVISSDTVPFALWCAARHLSSFEDALWTTVSGLGDRDTTCAMVGGIVALFVGPGGIPDAFSSPREPLPPELRVP